MLLLIIITTKSLAYITAGIESQGKKMKTSAEKQLKLTAAHLASFLFV